MIATAANGITVVTAEVLTADALIAFHAMLVRNVLMRRMKTMRDWGICENVDLLDELYDNLEDQAWDLDIENPNDLGEMED